MSQVIAGTSRKRRLPLPLYITHLLVAIAVIPLLTTVGSVEIFLQPALVSQGSTAMENDAQRQVQLIDAYLTERLNDVQVLSSSAPVKNFLLDNQVNRSAASDELFSALHRDIANYLTWSLFDTQGNVLLSYPTTPLAHGAYLILPEDMLQMKQSDSVFISDVFYDKTKNSAIVDLYKRVTTNSGSVLGYVRASLGLEFIWARVNNELQLNGPSSYAFILDQYGVRIAYTNPDATGQTNPASLFKAVAQLPASLQQRIRSEDLYGSKQAPLGVVANTTLATLQHENSPPATLQIVPPGRGQTYEMALYHSSIVPWTYFILKPLNEVTSLADQLILNVFLIVSLALIVAVLVGVFTGRRITLPILRSVAALRGNSQALKTLAKEEHVTASELSWMVEASDTGLQAFRYYTNASSTAAQRIYTVTRSLLQDMQYVEPQRLQKELSEIAEAAVYVERAAKQLRETNEKLLTTVRVTTQSAEQLAKGAKATDESASQLEQIVDELTAVVGETNVRP